MTLDEDYRGPIKAAAHGENAGLLFDLLAYAATCTPTTPGIGVPHQRLNEADDRQINWVMNAGLGPLLWRALKEGANEHVRLPLRDELLSAHLTAMARHGDLVDATREIVDACERRGARVTLLKGISVADQYYPAAHLRPMTDVDILAASPGSYATVESAILELGFRIKLDHVHREGAHHGAPLFHPERRIWIEIHDALFSEGSGLRSGRVFSPSNVAAQTVPSTFHGSAAQRLTDELQLVYIAASWVQDLSRYGISASFALPLVDAIFLLNASRHTLDWDRLLAGLDNPLAAASLHMLLSYLQRHGFYRVDAPIHARLTSPRSLADHLALEAVHGLLDRYLICGKPFLRLFSAWHASIVLATLLAPGPSTHKLAALPWNIVFPPGVAERYSARYQLSRVARLLGRRA